MWGSCHELLPRPLVTSLHQHILLSSYTAIYASWAELGQLYFLHSTAPAHTALRKAQGRRKSANKQARLGTWRLTGALLKQISLLSAFAFFASPTELFFLI